MTGAAAERVVVHQVAHVYAEGTVDEEAFGVYGLGGPAAPDASNARTVDARAVTPTAADLLGIVDSVGPFEHDSILA